MTTKYLFISRGDFICLKDSTKTTLLHDITPTTENCIQLSNDIHLYILETYHLQRYERRLLPPGHKIIYANCYDVMYRLHNNINAQTTTDNSETFDDFEKVRVLHEQIMYHIPHFEYLGLEEEEALKLANNNKKYSRVLQRDDKQYCVTAEGIVGRLNFYVRNYIVVKCTEG